jgi:hypothetical protein
VGPGGPGVAGCYGHVAGGGLGKTGDGKEGKRAQAALAQGTALVPRGYRCKTEVGQVGNSGVRALTLVSIYVFGHDIYDGPFSGF